MSLEENASKSRRTANIRTGGRSERVVREVLRVTLEELARIGYAALRVDEVAARAGVNKTTVYRRWPSKADLVTAAVNRFGGHDRAAIDTGSLRSDLVALVHATLDANRAPVARAVVRLISDAADNRELEPIVRVFRKNAHVARSLVVKRAQERGELPADVDATLLIDAIFLPVTMRMQRYGEDVDVETAEALVDLVLKGALQGGGRRALVNGANGTNGAH